MRMPHGRSALSTYESKRDFSRTPEPKAGGKSRGDLFVVQHHWATREHYDFRLELDGVLLSWAVTRGPSFNPADKRLAVRTEDHPVAYAEFEGTIPKGDYGGGTVQIWDRGRWQPQEGLDPAKALRTGTLKFVLHGKRMRGRWVLVRMKREGSRENWLLIKERDEFAKDNGSIDQFRTSVKSGRTKSQIEGSRSKARKTPTKKTAGTSKRRPAPAFISPMLCELHDQPPSGPGWMHETKYDGYRVQAAINGDAVVLYTREGLDWTARFPGIAQHLSTLGLTKVLVDGEAVVLDRGGLSSFTALVEALKSKRDTISYVAFDLLMTEGKSLRRRPLADRKKALAAALRRADERRVTVAPFVEAEGALVFRKAVDAGAEGIVSKRTSSLYESRRSPNWIKAKADSRDDVVIVGYVPSERRQFSSLLAAREEEGVLRFAGGVGTGFDQEELVDTLAKLQAIQRASPPEGLRGSERAPRKSIWVEPRWRAEIEYHGWTADRQLRHARFLGWREDRAERTNDIEPGMKKTASPTRSSRPTDARLERITHPERVVFKKASITKGDIAAYYLAVADRILPYLAKRPISFIRAPEGLGGEIFFQRHLLKGMSKGIQQIPDPGKEHADWVAIRDEEGLLTCAQFGIIELHGWGSTLPKLDAPDRVVFDLDPDPSLPFASVQAAALELRRLLDGIELESFPLLSGGKGIHVVVPLDRTQDWDTIADFASGLARGLAETDPKRYVAVASKSKRRGRIYIDWLRNRMTATAIVPWSLRARQEASVAVPVTWREMRSARSAADFAIADVVRRRDPWKTYFATKQRIPKQLADFLGGKAKRR